MFGLLVFYSIYCEYFPWLIMFDDTIFNGCSGWLHYNLIVRMFMTALDRHLPILTFYVSQKKTKA